MELVATRPTLVARAAPVLCGCAVAAAGVYVAAVDPSAAGSRFLPCPFRATTGLWCPGCGLTRGVHALLHGDVVRALSFNLFTPVVIALIAGGWLVWLRTASLGRPAPQALHRVPAVWWFVLGAVVIAYGVLRNVPAAPFDALAP